MDASLFKDLKNLKELELKRQKLTSLEPGILSGLCHLEILNLSDNQLTNLDDNVFNELQKLKELYLDNSYFASIKIQVLQPLVKLDLLGLDRRLFFDSQELWISVLDKSYDSPVLKESELKGYLLNEYAYDQSNLQTFNFPLVEICVTDVMANTKELEIIDSK